MGSRCPSQQHCARATQVLSKKCRSGSELPLAALCPIFPARDLNLRPPHRSTDERVNARPAGGI